MIQLSDVGLSAAATAKLAAYQAYVDSAQEYSERVLRAKRQFSSANNQFNSAFREVRSHLAEMCSGARRCMYCEDSAADEVEHHHPKNLYPDLAFVWNNYLYSCGPCNGPKNNKFAIINNDQITDVTRRTELATPPQSGPSALIHPRSENPLHFFILDIMGGTFRFTIHPQTTPIDSLRAAYTIDVLGLNKRDFLLVARREAFHSYLSRLRQYNLTKERPELSPPLEFQKDALLSMHHPTVFREMLRQAAFLQEVREVVQVSPEILTW